MSFSPQSQAVVEQLIRGECVASTSIKIGPLDQNTQVLLAVTTAHFAKLNGLAGDERANFLRTAYQSAKDALAVERTSEGNSDAPNDHSVTERARGNVQAALSPTPASLPQSQKSYRLIRVTCESFRGIAPSGESVSFEFNGTSNLIYGENGSGKSSLLGAIVWTLTGVGITDSHDHCETAPVFAASTTDHRGAKIIDWPVVVTLPNAAISKVTPSNCSALIELRTADDRETLFIRRTLAAGLEYSGDGSTWTSVGTLTSFGIDALDLQLSLRAPTTFARLSVESAPDTKTLLSLMLGFDDLAGLGDLATNISANRTRLATKEGKDLETTWGELKRRLTALAELVPIGKDPRPALDGLIATSTPAKVQIEAVGKLVAALITDAQSDLGQLLGISHEIASRNLGLADKVTAALIELQRDLRDLFPRLVALSIDRVFVSTTEKSSLQAFECTVHALSQFIENARRRIQERHDWWKSEITPGSKATLMLLAARFFDADSHTCPVCDQSVADLPIEMQLSQLRDANPELRETVKEFFRDLCEEVDEILPPGIQSLANQLPGARLLDDWNDFATRILPSECASLKSEFASRMDAIAGAIRLELRASDCMLPEEADADFATFARELMTKVNAATCAIDILRWGSAKLTELFVTIRTVLVESDQSQARTLLSALAVGKEAAHSLGPLNAALKELRWAYTERERITQKEVALAVLNELKAPIDELKSLRKYADGEVSRVFDSIRDETISNWKTLYPETPSTLAPAHLVVGSGRDKTVTALLSNGDSEVPAQFFGNAGLQRAIALSFFFALLEKHPNGLGFVVLDDPVLSLDDGHRERWSREILMPRMTKTQFVVATHQEHYFTNCRSHFRDGQVVQLNCRLWPRRITCQPGNRLDRAEGDIENSRDGAPNQMRKFCEELLETLETFSSEPFVDPKNLVSSVDKYLALPMRDPLASPKRAQIVDTLRDHMVTSVVNPGSHHHTQPSVTTPMSRDCLSLLRKCEREFFKPELARLERDLRHRRRRASISIAQFATLPNAAVWDEPIEVASFGSAAAKHESWVVDSSEAQETTTIMPGDAILVTGQTLDPIAKSGQWVLLGPSDALCKGGDLVAVTCANGDHLLRRLWENKDALTLQSINPVHPIPDVGALRTECAPRRIVGVLYSPTKLLSGSAKSQNTEWCPRADFQIEWLEELAAVRVEGASLDPIARSGQKVLIDKVPVLNCREIRNGELAVVDTNVEAIGRVIKRVFHQADNCILTSPNPVDPHEPLFLRKADLNSARFWRVRGVLFESTDG